MAAASLFDIWSISYNAEEFDRSINLLMIDTVRYHRDSHGFSQNLT